MQANILKMSFLMAYLTILICVISGIPFITAIFRGIILLAVFSLTGFLMRWYFLNVIGSVEQEKEDSFQSSEREESTEEEDYNTSEQMENVEQGNY